MNPNHRMQPTFQSLRSFHAADAGRWASKPAPPSKTKNDECRFAPSPFD